MNTPTDVHSGFHAGLLKVHDALRSMLQEIVTHSNAAASAEVARLATQYAGFLNGHHHMEDMFLFPAIRGDSRLRTSDVAFLEGRAREHRDIHGACDALLAAAGRIVSRDSAALREELRRVARELQALLGLHLLEEEAGLAPQNLARMISSEALLRLKNELEAARSR